jgi:hypothetical protein
MTWFLGVSIAKSLEKRKSLEKNHQLFIFGCYYYVAKNKEGWLKFWFIARFGYKILRDGHHIFYIFLQWMMIATIKKIPKKFTSFISQSCLCCGPWWVLFFFLGGKPYRFGPISSSTFPPWLHLNCLFDRYKGDFRLA